MIVVVTGATRGIGREVAAQLAARRDQVVVTGRRAGDVADVADGLGGDAFGLVVDVSDPDSVAAATDELAGRVDHVDGLVNNAAIHYDTWQRAATADLAVVQEALDTNVLGPWRMVLALLPLLRGSAHGRIVNVSSEAGSISGLLGAGTPAYAVSKTGLNALTRLLAGDLAADGILVNSVCPGWIATDMGGRGGEPVAVGARRVLWGLDLPDGGPTGGFWRDGRALPW